MGEDGKAYPLVAMPDVERWVAANEREGLVLRLDVSRRLRWEILEGARLVSN